MTIQVRPETIVLATTYLVLEPCTVQLQAIASLVPSSSTFVRKGMPLFSKGADITE